MSAIFCALLIHWIYFDRLDTHELGVWLVCYFALMIWVVGTEAITGFAFLLLPESNRHGWYAFSVDVFSSFVGGLNLFFGLLLLSKFFDHVPMSAVLTLLVMSFITDLKNITADLNAINGGGNMHVRHTFLHIFSHFWQDFPVFARTEAIVQGVAWLVGEIPGFTVALICYRIWQ